MIDSEELIFTNATKAVENLYNNGFFEELETVFELSCLPQNCQLSDEVMEMVSDLVQLSKEGNKRDICFIKCILNRINGKNEELKNE